MRNAQGLSAVAQEAVHEAVIDMPGLSLIFGLSIVGTGAWVVALIAAAIALRRAGASRGSFIFLILAGVFLMGGHTFPFGTLAFGCFFLATAWLTSASQPSRVSCTSEKSVKRKSNFGESTFHELQSIASNPVRDCDSNDSVALALEHSERPGPKGDEVALRVVNLRLGGRGPPGAMEDLAFAGNAALVDRTQEVHVHLYGRSPDAHEREHRETHSIIY